jgi:hypothetical protein
MDFIEYADRVDLTRKGEMDRARLIAYYWVKTHKIADFVLADLLQLWGQLNVPQPNVTRLAGRLTAAEGFPRSPKRGHFRLHADVTRGLEADYEELFNAPAPTVAPRSGGRTLIDESRIAELRTLTGRRLDPLRLVRICEEINISYSMGCLMAVAVLSRTLINHVPPAFGFTAFAQVASNYGGGRSFKKVAEKLEETARAIGDMIAHETMRASETLPSPAMIDFSQELDVLLGEVIRLLK